MRHILIKESKNCQQIKISHDICENPSYLRYQKHELDSPIYLTGMTYATFLSNASLFTTNHLWVSFAKSIHVCTHKLCNNYCTKREARFAKISSMISIFSISILCILVSIYSPMKKFLLQTSKSPYSVHM